MKHEPHKRNGIIEGLWRNRQRKWLLTTGFRVQVSASPYQKGISA